MQMLKSKIAVVTGASRGAGRGIAMVLGEAGASSLFGQPVSCQNHAAAKTRVDHQHHFL